MSWCADGVCGNGHGPVIWGWAIAIFLVPAVIAVGTFISVMRIRWLKRRGKW